MLTEILIAIISGGITLIGVLISNNKKQAIIENEIKHLREEVNKHNDFATRIPVIAEQIKIMNHRIDDLERK